MEPQPHWFDFGFGLAIGACLGRLYALILVEKHVFRSGWRKGYHDGIEDAKQTARLIGTLYHGDN